VAIRCRVEGVAVGGRDLNWERIPLAEGRPGYDANNLSLALEGFRTGACGHGAILFLGRIATILQVRLSPF